MSYKVDQRGSKDQRILYDFVSELYPNTQIVYEQPLADLGQRIDIFIPNLAIAIEYNGIQHYKFVEHFHRTLENFEYQLKLDIQKREYLLLRGIKVIDIPYDQMVSTKEELATLIQTTPYPDFPYQPFADKSESQETYKKTLKAKRQNDYKSKKESFKEDPEKRKERLTKEKQFRKERYNKIKENK